MKKELLINVIAYLFVILFVYTALSKWFLYSVYVSDLQRSPELGPFAGPISIIIPASELIVAGFLLFKRTQLLGFYGALLLMICFTLYVTYVLAMTTRRPCTCGGIIRELSWPNHLILNIILTFLALVGVLLTKRLVKNNSIQIPQNRKSLKLT